MSSLLSLGVKYALSAALIVVISELGKRSSWLGAALATIPLTSLLAFVWLHLDGSSTEAIAQMSTQIFWLVLASLPLFLMLPWLLHRGFGFWLSLILPILLSSLAYLATLHWLKTH